MHKKYVKSRSEIASRAHAPRQMLARRIYCTVTVIFSTTLLRAVFSLMNGIGSQGFKDRNVACDDCDAECMKNVYVVMAKYL